MSAPSRERARAILRQATPRPPLLCGGSSHPNISIFIYFILARFVIECKYNLFRGIAQLVEHRSPKPGVGGSSPSAPASKYMNSKTIKIVRRRRLLPLILLVGLVFISVLATEFFVASIVLDAQMGHNIKDDIQFYIEEPGNISPEIAETFLRTTEESSDVVEIRKRGTIYLTFDDGPGPYTNILLDILKQYGVRATFFVTGAGDDAVILREYEEGHALGLHTFSHQYAYIYQNVDNFMNDLIKVQERVKNITGQTVMLMRFPGGSSNTISMRYDGRKHIMTKLVAEVEKRGFTYFDWNIVSGDAGETTVAEEVYNNVVSKLGDGDFIVLQHDIKDFSVAAVEKIIKYGYENGYDFATLTADSFTAHHGVDN